MTRRHTLFARRILALALGPALALVLLGGAMTDSPAPAIVNESPSLPKGLYLRISDAAPVRGAVVTIAQPPAIRAYTARLGMPADVRLIKRVAATGGDAVCADGRWLVAPGRLLPVHARDRAGTVLPVWRGCRRLEADERFLLGDTPNSLDSRYFGPVRTVRIEGVYREALTW
ncbi:hypothetical protein BZG35_17075 [Brevundimonas sp. LM2]|uniref:S26 family signal peptidase n=1 Tax=Brevundimonas sp. LM2 TaxID=1938605 RepID=UPI000983C34E|nr:S26 family signal peptidase [Brevundimonas sp. LM2]AQR63168.1 hypothetical protein BZG35_17075 [Brevundimonas sp. LM2]